jgi:hypothetical protein
VAEALGVGSELAFVGGAAAATRTTPSTAAAAKTAKAANRRRVVKRYMGCLLVGIRLRRTALLLHYALPRLTAPYAECP